MTGKKTNGTGKGRGRGRSKAEGMTEAKENEVEVRGVGDNSLDLKPVEIDERDFKVHYNAIKGATDRKETAMSLLRSAKKRAKEAGPDVLAAVERAMKFERMDQDDLARELQIAGYALKATDSPIQLTLHNTLLGDAAEQADKRGYRDAKDGKSASNPYPDGSDLAKAYMSGWERGMTENLNMGTGDGEAAREGENTAESDWPDDAQTQPVEAAEQATTH